MLNLRKIVESRVFQRIILTVICLNAVLFALQTSPRIVARVGSLLNALDLVCLAVFVMELVLKILVRRHRFFYDPWNVFDFIVVAVSFLPDMGVFSSVRLFRVLRVFKLISGVRQMRVIMDAIFRSIPGMGWASGILGLIYFVYGILATNLFGAAFPDWFGSLGASVYSLFQVMTLESWSMGIVRPVMEKYPSAWIFFISYILLTTFTVMNIVVGIILNSISESSARQKENSTSPSGDRKAVLASIQRLRKEMDELEQMIAHDDARQLRG